jgi:hypothetical protein
VHRSAHTSCEPGTLAATLRSAGATFTWMPDWIGMELIASRPSAVVRANGARTVRIDQRPEPLGYLGKSLRVVYGRKRPSGWRCLAACTRSSTL